MRGPTVAITGGLVFIALCVACALIHGGAIEGDLLRRASAALAVRELPAVEVTFNGRDASLAGVVSSETLRTDAERIVAEVAGVRVVRNGLAVEPTVAGDAPLQEEIDGMLAGGTIEFATGSDRITEAGQATLDLLAAVLTEHDVDVEIGGHTDSRGGEEANRLLSQQRADAVRRYLLARGIADERLTAVGYGESRPIADDATAEGRERNRRITFEIRREE